MVLEPPCWLQLELSVDCSAEKGSTMWFASARSHEMLCKLSLVSISRKHMTEVASGVGCRQGLSLLLCRADGRHPSALCRADKTTALWLNRYKSRLARLAPWGAAWGMVGQIHVQASQAGTLVNGGKMLHMGLGAEAQVRQSVCECGCRLYNPFLDLGRLATLSLCTNLQCSE